MDAGERFGVVARMVGAVVMVVVLSVAAGCAHPAPVKLVTASERFWSIANEKIQTQPEPLQDAHGEHGSVASHCVCTCTAR